MPLFVLILAISGILTWNGYSRFNAFNQEESISKQRIEASLIASALQQKIKSYFSALDSFVVEFNDKNEFQNTAIVTQALKALKQTDPSIQAAFVALKDGRSFENGRFFPNFNARELKKEWYIRAFAGEKNIITKAYFGEGSRKMCLHLLHRFIAMASRLLWLRSH
ncbi:PDC sensor domain-containing protein [Vibrio sp. PP-XX7]